MSIRRSFRLLSFHILVAAALAVTVPTTHAQGDMFPRLDDERQRAMIAADTVALDTLLADGCIYTHSTGRVQSKDELVAMLASGRVSYDSFAIAKRRVDEYDSTIVITGLQTIALTVGGKPLTSHSRYTAVWVRDGAGWRCVAYQSTPIPETGEGQ